jgi:hypothetical protein
MREIIERDREMARELLSAITDVILRAGGLSASNNDPAIMPVHIDTDTASKNHSATIEIALAQVVEAIATAREEGRNPRERELLALTDRDFIIISREEYDRLNAR